MIAREKVQPQPPRHLWRVAGMPSLMGPASLLGRLTMLAARAGLSAFLALGMMAVSQGSQSDSANRQEKVGHSSNRAPSRALRLETFLVLLEVSVEDLASARLISGLGKDDFLVLEEGQEQTISFLAPGDSLDLPRSIILILDWSASQDAYFQRSVEAAKALIGKLSPADEVAIVTDDVELLVDFTRDRARLIAELDRLVRLRERGRRGRSQQLTALFAALRELVNRDDKRFIIIFQTDGDELPLLKGELDRYGFPAYFWERPRRPYSLSDIHAAALRSRATIYSIIPGDRLIGLGPEEFRKRGRQVYLKMVRARFGEDRANLSNAAIEVFAERLRRNQQALVQLAELTGGWAAFLEEPQQADQIYERILSDVYGRYIIGYYPANPARGFRRVQVQVRGHGEYIIRGRGGYYMPAR
jgi:VWFA-related protein